MLGASGLLLRNANMDQCLILWRRRLGICGCNPRALGTRAGNAARYLPARRLSWRSGLRLNIQPPSRGRLSDCRLFPTRKIPPNANLLAYAYGLRALPGDGRQAGPIWLHEVKHDGYRMLVIRENDRVRLLSRNGTDWTKRYPWIAEAALKNRQKHFVIDGEAVILGLDGISDFNALHSRKHDREVRLYAFDVLAMDGDDLRDLPLHLRKNKFTAPVSAAAERNNRGAVRAGRHWA